MHFEVVEVSGANQYRVKPAELVTTCWPPMVLTSRAVPPELEAGAELLAPAAGVEVVELLPELAHADRTSARAARPAAPHTFAS